jgi:DNA-binding transcriptional ArsR family regulator
VPSGFVQGSDEYRISQAIAGTLREIDEAAARPTVMEWFRTQLHEAAQHVRRQAEVQARLQAGKEAHARVILADTRAGGSKFTDKNRPPDRTGWIWDRAVLLPNAVGGPGDLAGPPSGALTEPDSASCPVESGAGEFEPRRRLLAQAQAARDSGWRSAEEARADLPVVGWFPQPSEEPLPEVWDTPAGSAALLALLHDRCLVDTTEPHNDRRIVIHAEELESLVASELLFMASLVNGNAEDEIARRWRLVEPKLPTAPVIGGTQPPDSSPGESDRGRQPQAPAHVALHPDDMKIMRCLADSDMTLTQEKIEEETSLSHSTVNKRLSYLREHDLVHRPRGDRGGETLTAQGEERLSKTGDTD